MLKIGIPTNLRDGRFGTHGNYIEWVSQFGTPILLTPGIDQYDQFDVLFLPGGKDVATNKTTFLQGPSDPHLQWFDKVYIHRSFETGKPIFGVCRGMQSINVHFGGTLRNLYGENLVYSTRWNSEEEKNKSHEKIKTSFYKNYFREIKTEERFVNSLHHQVVDKLANDFICIAESVKCGHPEAIIHKDGMVAGVQWHPEKINDDLAKDIFNFILK